MSPQEYDEWLWSFESDPPIEEQIKTLTRLVAQLIADQRNIHRGKDSPAVSASDFLPPEPHDDDESSDDNGEGVSEVAAAIGAHEGLRAGLGLTEERRSVPLIPRVGVPVDPGLFARMTGGQSDDQDAD